MIGWIGTGIIFVTVWIVGGFTYKQYCKVDNSVEFIMFYGAILGVFADIVSKVAWNRLAQFLM